MIKLLKACCSCRHSKQIGEKDYFCPIQNDEVIWCGTCPKFEMLVYNKDALIDVTKEFTFDSCHQLKEYNGACARLHGHTYKLQVTVKGKVNNIGMVLDFKDLKKLVNDYIIKDLDHYNLNDKLIFNTTAENMVVYFYDVLDRCIKEIAYNEDRVVFLDEVKLWETPTSFASYKGVEAKC